MKKHLVPALLILLTAAPLFAAAPWGVVESAADSVGEGKKQHWYTNGLINEIYDGKEITYCVQGDAVNAPSKDYPELIEDAFNSWLKDTRKYIDASDRSQEFEDLLPILDRKVNLRYVECPCGLNKKPFMKGIYFQQSYTCLNQGEEPRIFFIIGKDVSSANGNKSSGAFHKRDKETGRHLVVVDVNYGARLYDILQHEIGHALGLGDQYDEALHNSLPQTGIRDELPSIMNNAKTIQCDDAEGIINLMDCFRQPPAQPFFRGGDKGWKSICADRDITYAKCLAKGRADGIVVSADERSLNINKYDKSGRLKKQKEIRALFHINPYNIYDKRSYAKEERDGRGRLKYLKDLKGNETFFEYTAKGFKYYTMGDFNGKRIAFAYVKVEVGEEGELWVTSGDEGKEVRASYEGMKDGWSSVYKEYQSYKETIVEESASFKANDTNRFEYWRNGDIGYGEGYCIYGECGLTVSSYAAEEAGAVRAYLCKYSGKYANCSKIIYSRASGEIYAFENDITLKNMESDGEIFGINFYEYFDNYDKDYNSKEAQALRKSMTQEKMIGILYDIEAIRKDALKISEIKLPEVSQATEKERIAALKNIVLNRGVPQEHKQSAEFDKRVGKMIKERMKELDS